MATRFAARTTTAKRKKAANTVLVRYRNKDTAFGVSRNTVTRLAKTLGMSETQVMHMALARFARQTLPSYEPDDEPLSGMQEKETKGLLARMQTLAARKGVAAAFNASPKALGRAAVKAARK